jgi:hypothetical protein
MIDLEDIVIWISIGNTCCMLLCFLFLFNSWLFIFPLLMLIVNLLGNLAIYFLLPKEVLPSDFKADD